MVYAMTKTMNFQRELSKSIDDIGDIPTVVCSECGGRGWDILLFQDAQPVVVCGGSLCFGRAFSKVETVTLSTPAQDEWACVYKVTDIADLRLLCDACERFNASTIATFRRYGVRRGIFKLCDDEVCIDHAEVKLRQAIEKLTASKGY